ncbi:MAG: MAPEG family protein [Pseudomonadota bacterium]
MVPVTTTTAIFLGIWLCWLSARVIRARGTEGISLGAGDNELLERRIRGQANLSEYGPTALILLFLAEFQGANFWALVVLAALLVVGRLIHGIAFSFTDKWVFGRVGGMIMTFTAIMALAFLNIWTMI